MTEAQFQAKVMKHLKNKGAYVIKMWGGGRFTRAGIPDIIFCLNGFYMAVELKSETGRPSKLQEYNIEEIRRAGGFAMVLRPDGYEKFKDLIEEVIRWSKPNFPTVE